MKCSGLRKGRLPERRTGQEVVAFLIGADSFGLFERRVVRVLDPAYWLADVAGFARIRIKHPKAKFAKSVQRGDRCINMSHFIATVRL